MKYIYTSLIFLSCIGIPSSVYSQSDWSKTDRNTLYDECMDYLRKYSNLTNEQRENLSLCFLDEVTKKYPHTEYKEKIDIELRKIRESSLSICSKNLGISLNEQKQQPEEVKPKQTSSDTNKLLPVRKENLVGHWKDKSFEYWLFASGDCKVISQTGNRTMGTWNLIDNRLYVYKEKNSKTLVEYKIIELSSQAFVYRTTERNSDIVIANRVSSM